MIDDDDFDVLSDQANANELSSLLAEVSAAKPTPLGKTQLSEALPSLEPLARTTREGPVRVGAEPALAAAAAVAPDEVYGLVGVSLWEQMGYAYRVLDVGTRLRERGVLLARDLAGSSRTLDEAHAALGRAIHDAAESARIVLDPEALTPVRTAVTALDAIAKSRADASKKTKKLTALAAARRESASASLDPAQADQEARLSALDGAERERERCQAAFDAAQRQFRDATNAGAEPEVRRTIDALVDATRTELQVAERAHRDAALAFAESRRRALLQIGRVHEAEQAASGLAVEERVALREAERREDIVLRALREAYAALGASSFDLGKGRAATPNETSLVEQTRAERARRQRDLDALRTRARSFDEDAYRRGRLGFIAGGVVILLVLVIIGVGAS